MVQFSLTLGAMAAPWRRVGGFGGCVGAFGKQVQPFRSPRRWSPLRHSDASSGVTESFDRDDLSELMLWWLAYRTPTRCLCGDLVLVLGVLDPRTERDHALVLWG